jgi:hypothetical protein
MPTVKGKGNTSNLGILRYLTEENGSKYTLYSWLGGGGREEI